ncbi:MAG: type IV pilus assembly protein PilM [Candidatus Pacebacteria bacterium]|nr:type IV pilus assembly protein PilM [Candidatus Paceibacterota bacterium]
MWNFIQALLPRKFLGIDIGTSYVKMVEMYRFGHQRKLENYGQISASVFYDKPFRTFDKNTLSLSNKDVAKAIKAVKEEAGIKTQKVVFSIPDFSTFFTNFNLPSMTREELPQAIKYEAKQYIPLPLSEVTLDWQIIGDKPLANGKKGFKILLVAAPNEIISQYQEIAKLSQMELFSLEAEAFSLMRALVGEEEKRPIALIDIGAQSTTCTIVDKRALKSSHSFDTSGDDFTSMVAQSLSIGFAKAEKIKRQYGIRPLTVEEGQNVQNIRSILLPLIDVILREVQGICNTFYQQEKKEIQKVIIAGGTALLPGLKEYFEETLNKEVEIANPFTNIFYPPILEEKLKEMGPGYSIAVGTALRGLEY